MLTIIYPDVLVLQNFCMNYLLLYLTNRLLKLEAKIWRMCLAALVGGIYVMSAFIPGINNLYSFIMKILVSGLMIVIAFSPYKLRDFMKTIIIFYIETFLLGGCIFAIMYMNDYNPEYQGSVFITGNAVVRAYVVGGSIIATLFVKLGFDFFENHYKMQNRCIDVEVIIDGKSCRVTGLIDTGNSLRDPLTNKPITIMYLEAIKDIFPDEVKKRLEQAKTYSEFLTCILNSVLKPRIRLVPYNALGVENGMLTAVRADVLIASGKNFSSVVKQPVIALYEKPLSSNNEYQALMYPEILGGNRDENNFKAVGSKKIHRKNHRAD